MVLQESEAIKVKVTTLTRKIADQIPWRGGLAEGRYDIIGWVNDGSGYQILVWSHRYQDYAWVPGHRTTLSNGREVVVTRFDEQVAKHIYIK